jgi:hypothetical protein
MGADKTRVDKLWTAVARPFRGIDLCRSESMEAGSMEEAGSGHEASHNILNVGCLAGFVRSQVTLELSNHADTADM